MNGDDGRRGHDQADGVEPLEDRDNDEPLELVHVGDNDDVAASRSRSESKSHDTCKKRTSPKERVESAFRKTKSKHEGNCRKKQADDDDGSDDEDAPASGSNGARNDSHEGKTW
ncbi:hypothetical protein SEMRO_523_G159730.1 [Seminavis robusta]|uniref:Uncharacterized protein n=1 Tax=Seminavis robusta TaxID=568900 RepID=A0A9N8HGR5_9STRA|nr:hypothetical protein SEMRO_523_G159730.1 [Seminavis robusta]|eukprot:Sro523_g159730.1 n/a (114) ;mRNA; f:20331-20672